jgi:tetratricopeptide (TPR) repeat protein
VGQLRRPLVPEGPIQTFYDRLHALHLAGGQPSMRTLQRRTRDANRPNGINPTTIHDAFVASRLARWEVVAAIVIQLDGDVDEFATLWRAARHAELRTVIADLRRPAAAGGQRPSVDAATPCLLPPDIADFTGRKEQVAELSRLLAPRRPVPLVVTGPGGVGKTALAVHVAHGSREAFPDGQLYVDLRGVDRHPVEPAEALARFLRALGVDGPRIPTDLAERAEVYRARLAGRAVLVMLDNAANEAQIEPLIPGLAGCAVLVTSRTRLTGLPGVHVVELDALDDTTAVRLLGTLVGVHRVAAEPELTGEVVRHCCGMPLALRIVGARMAARPHWTMGRLAERLADQRHRLDELRHGHLQVRASLALSYAGLDPPAQRLLRGIALLDAPDVAAWVAAPLLRTSLGEATDVVDRLVDARLLDAAVDPHSGHPRFRMHDLTRLYAQERAAAEDSPAERADALTRVLGAWLALVQAAHVAVAGGDFNSVHGTADRWIFPNAFAAGLLADPLAWYDTERVGIVAAVRQAANAHLDELCWDLAVTAASLFGARSHYDDKRTALQHALAATREAGNRRGEAAVLCELGGLCLDQGDHETAADMLERSRTLSDNIGDRHGSAIALWRLGSLDHVLDRWPAAVRRLEAARAAIRGTGDRGCEALVLRTLGTTYRRLGRLDLAEVHLTAATAISREIRSDRLLSQSLYRLGELHFDRGDLAAAETAFQTVLGLVCRLGDRAGQAYARYGVGRVLAGTGRRSEAVAVLVDALQDADAVGIRLAEAQILITLAELHRSAGEPDMARARLARAVDICTELRAAALLDRARYALDQMSES